jgi:signal transduction histidine kinase
MPDTFPVKLSRMSLRMTLLLYVVLPITVVIAMTTTLLLSAFETRVEERMEDDVQLVARALEIPVAQALERGQPEGLIGALESAIGINRVYGAYVYDIDGETIASTGPLYFPADEQGLSSMAFGGVRQGRYDEISGRGVYSYFVPLTSSGGVPSGLLHITRRERDIRASVTSLRRHILLLALGGILLVGGLVVYGHRGSLGRDLDRIRAAMQKVEQGDLNYRAPETGPRELAEVASGLNSMLDSVERAEKEVRSSREEQDVLRSRLRQAEKLAAIGTLAAGVAHELGTPLSVIAGRAQRLRRRQDLSDGVDAGLQGISREVHRMERIVRQLLDFGRQYDPDFRSVSPYGLAAAAARALEDEAEKRSVEVDVARYASPTRIEVDPLRIEQALTNLLRNAIDAAPGGHVRVQGVQEDASFCFVIEDDGPGIPEDVRDRIFEPFFTTKEVGEGTGLGLAVVHGIADEHDGEVAVESSECGGARILLRLPIRRTFTEAVPIS